MAACGPSRPERRGRLEVDGQLDLRGLLGSARSARPLALENPAGAAGPCRSSGCLVSAASVAHKAAGRRELRGSGRSVGTACAKSDQRAELLAAWRAEESPVGKRSPARRLAAGPRQPNAVHRQVRVRCSRCGTSSLNPESCGPAACDVSRHADSCIRTGWVDEQRNRWTAVGTSSCSRAGRQSAPALRIKFAHRPVRLPPGRFRSGCTRPCLTRVSSQLPICNTIGMVVVAALAAIAAAAIRDNHASLRRRIQIVPPVVGQSMPCWQRSAQRKASVDCKLHRTLVITDVSSGLGGARRKRATHRSGDCRRRNPITGIAGCCAARGVMRPNRPHSADGYRRTRRVMKSAVASKAKSSASTGRDIADDQIRVR